MFKVKVTYNEKAIKDKIFKAVQEGMIKVVRNKIQPFEQEIENEGGEVNISFTEQLTIQVSITGISTDLKERVENALNGT